LEYPPDVLNEVMPKFKPT